MPEIGLVFTTALLPPYGACDGKPWHAMARHQRQIKPLLVSVVPKFLQTHVVTSRVSLPLLQLVTVVALTAQRLQGTHRLSVSEW
jgi:hypothetical protein